MFEDSMADIAQTTSSYFFVLILVAGIGALAFRAGSPAHPSMPGVVKAERPSSTSPSNSKSEGLVPSTGTPPEGAVDESDEPTSATDTGN